MEAAFDNMRGDELGKDLRDAGVPAAVELGVRREMQNSVIEAALAMRLVLMPR